MLGGCVRITSYGEHNEGTMTGGGEGKTTQKKLTIGHCKILKTEARVVDVADTMAGTSIWAAGLGGGRE